MSITSALVNELRNKTGAGMMDCKKALVNTNGDINQAIEWLRKQGIASATKKSDRAVNEGSVACAIKDHKAVLVELNCETDFVAKNEQFQNVINKIASHALNSETNNVDELLQSHIESNKTVKDYILENVAVVGENLTLKRFANVKNEKGLLFSYIHNVYSKNSGKIAVLVELDSDLGHAELKDLGHKLAMHVAAMKPLVLNVEELDKGLVEKEKEIFTEQSKASGKPAPVIEKMVEGRIRKFYEEVVLNEQLSMFDGKTKIKDYVAEAANKLGGKISIKSYQRFELGAVA
jgi:elongation factor Ts